MRRFVLPLLLASSLAWPAPAAPLKPEPPKDLPTAMAQHQETLAALASKDGENAAALKKWYHTSLDMLRKEATAKGDLDAVLAIDAERTRAESDLTPEQLNALPPTLKPYRQKLDQTRGQLAAQRRMVEAAQLRAYVATLEDLQKRVTQSGDIEGALQVKNEKSAAAQRLADFASTAPAPASAAAPSGTADSSPASPMAGAESTPPRSAGAAEKPVAPMGRRKVATLLSAKNKVVDPADDVIPFQAPAGDGRSGAKGILLKNSPEVGKSGSTWRFLYKRGGAAQTMQILHPHGSGIVIIHLGQSSVGISSVARWAGVGYGGGEKKGIQEKKTTVLPLQEGQEYEVVSAMGPTGGYRLTINGEVVAKTRFAATRPLSIQLEPGDQYPGHGRGDGEFQGDNLPMLWSAGFAALIVGPIDSGPNQCREIYFDPSAPTGL
jgi:hypothetical protein